jgi:hypothetical protein
MALLGSVGFKRPPEKGAWKVMFDLLMDFHPTTTGVCVGLGQNTLRVSGNYHRKGEDDDVRPRAETEYCSGRAF